MENGEINDLKQKVIDGGCPLRRWVPSPGFTVGDGKKLDEVGTYTKCHPFKDEIKKIGEFESKRFRELQYQDVPNGFRFITNTTMGDGEVRKWVGKEYGRYKRFFIKDTAYYLPDLESGVKVLPKHRAVYIK